jgi:FeS assembly SUF system protein
MTQERTLEAIEADVVAALKTVYDPEIPVDIYELGLIYDVDVKEDRSVEVRLTLTSPMCPVAGTLPPEVEAKVAQVEGVSHASVDLVWDPPWSPAMMSEAARLELGMY